MELNSFLILFIFSFPFNSSISSYLQFYEPILACSTACKDVLAITCGLLVPSTFSY